MIRFSMNRWSGFLLTLCLLTVSFFLLGLSAPATALADSNTLLMPSEPISPSGPANGDPDVPMGPGDGKAGLTWKPLGRVDAERTVTRLSVRPAGDVAVSGSVVVDRMRLLLLSLRSLYLGF
jgi:hypothetical protein